MVKNLRNFMIKNFPSALMLKRVHYVLISGQTTILYGIATFSEDIDIWIKPSLFEA